MTPSPASNLSRSRGAFTFLLVGALVALLALPALAARGGSLTVGTGTIDPGTSTTLDAEFTESSTSVGGTIVSIVITPQAGATGTVTLSTSGVTCVPNTGAQVDCLWQPPSTIFSVALTAAASPDATGTFDIVALIEGDDPDTPGNDIVSTQVATTTLSITPPPTTTTSTTVTSTTIAPTSTTMAPTTTAEVGGETLPFTGPEDPGLGGIAVALLALGALLVAATSRRSESG